MQAKQKIAQYRQNQIGIDFVSCPDQDYVRVFITGQILSAKNFPNTEIYISYKFSLPPGWEAEIPDEIIEAKLTPEQLKEFNCLESITQTVSPMLVPNEDGGTTNQFYFSFPIDLQLIAKSKATEHAWPSLLFEVFEKDSWERITMQGCGFLQIPNEPGTHLVETQTWKPSLDYRTRVFEFFLGGLARPKRLQDIAKGYQTSQLDNKGPANRVLFSTISSGSVCTRLSIAMQSKKVKNEQRINYKVVKFSQETEQVKSEYSKGQMPGQVNTGNMLGGRFTVNKLNHGN